MSRIFAALLLLAAGSQGATGPTRVKVVVVAMFETGEDTGDRDTPNRDPAGQARQPEKAPIARLGTHATSMGVGTETGLRSV